MGTFYVKIEVGDIDGQRFEEMEALADTGAMTTVVPGSVLHRLGVEPVKSQVFEYADGREVELDMAETKIRVDGKETITWVIFGEETAGATLGAYTLSGVFLARRSARPAPNARARLAVARTSARIGAMRMLQCAYPYRTQTRYTAQGGK